MTVQDVAVDLETFAREWRDWRSRQQAQLADAHGFLSITKRAGHDILRPRHPENRLPVAIEAGEKIPRGHRRVTG
ncbi:MAG TPA: hypothetical protein VGZ32_08045 [Actinocrinis sp.]|jgi:hypothetical protein|uniref:hypothetical protein n=1 Tax=Actinocrinis sp. TaxID=1920516 RepID=UPI002DDD06A1|nr:hypothetical protein [Actinocrinis sp.]HEV3170274.1 hypothetical protein [Actinocrinis sp.]